MKLTLTKEPKAPKTPIDLVVGGFALRLFEVVLGFVFRFGRGHRRLHRGLHSWFWLQMRCRSRW